MSSSTPPGGTSGRIARRPDTGSFTSVATLLPPPPPPPPPASSSALVPVSPASSVAGGSRTALGTSEGQRRILLVLLAAATVLALVATVGVAVLWAGNRKMAADRAAALQTTVDGLPTSETVEGLAGRVQGMEDWTGLPDEGAAGATDLQTRLQEVSRGVDGLEDDLRDGLGSVRSDISSVRGEVANQPSGVAPAELDAVRQDLDAVRDAVNDLRQDVGALCWALSSRPQVAVTC